jgi:hypothetical protein
MKTAVFQLTAPSQYLPIPTTDTQEPFQNTIFSGLKLITTCSHRRGNAGAMTKGFFINDGKNQQTNPELPAYHLEQQQQPQPSQLLLFFKQKVNWKGHIIFNL